ncbi:MAG: AAA family ATPase [Methanothrix sp.]|nr:MAG: AAA family ATPase [Methanothrix sp.]
MIITVSGPPGSGTTTLAREMAKELGLDWINSGDLFRKIAQDRNMSLKELGRLAEQSPEIDYQIDDAQKKIADEQGGVFEGRLSGHLLDADLKILLRASMGVWAERIVAREGGLVEDVFQEGKIRNECEVRRYKKYYNIDLDDREVYDLVIDTDTWDAKGVLEIALAAARALKDEVKASF